jgi:hypothetical protein
VKGYLLAGFISLLFFSLTVRSIRKRQLTELTAILWLGVSVVTVLLSALLPTGAFNSTAYFFGIKYPPDMVLVFGVLFLVLLTYQITVMMSRLSARQRVLVQELALLKAELASKTREE